MPLCIRLQAAPEAEEEDCISTSFGSKVSIYDSLNSSPTQQFLQQITALYSPANSIPESHQAVIVHPQEGSTDCGVFAIAYAFELALGNDPSLFMFDQSKMREHLLACFENRYVSPFQKSRRILTPSKSINITRGVSPTQKWSTPKKTAPLRQQPMH
jgi:hypothetical protein